MSSKYGPDVIQIVGLVAMIVGLFRVLGPDWGLLAGGALVLLAGGVVELGRIRAAAGVRRREEG